MMVKKITLLGHKDHGKSTLIGNMLILTNRVNPAKLKEAERTSRSWASASSRASYWTASMRKGKEALR